MDIADAVINQNVASITLPDDVDVTVEVKTNSQSKQKVSIKSDKGDVNLNFEGSGERNKLGGETQTKRFGSPLKVTFEYADASGKWKPSTLQKGGPYAVGRLNILFVVAENGDDADYNDCTLQFSWHSPR